MKLSLEIRARGELTIVYCQGRIAFREEAAALSRRIADLLPQTRHLVLDLSGVEAIDSAGLGELVVVLMWAKSSGRGIKFAAPRRQVYRMLELTNLTSVFEIHSTLEDAILSCHGQVA